MDFAIGFAHKNQAKSIELIVNQHNSASINIYQKYGFKIIERLVNKFPNGHSVEDYKMCKTLC